MKLKRHKVNTAAPGKPRGSVLIIYTGGTIGMIMQEDRTLPTFDFRKIIKRVPVLSTFSLVLEVISFEEPIDSSNMKPDLWVLLAEIIKDNYDNHDGFVVLHGTDTMSYSASALSFMLQGLSKPVIFTGSLLPVFSPRSDAHENLITAIEIASRKIDGKAVVPEVCIYFDYFLYRGNRAKKIETHHFDSFKSENYPPLAEAGTTIEFNYNAILSEKKEEQLIVNRAFDTNVVIVKLFPGLSPYVVRQILQTEGLKGVVLESFGSGNAPTNTLLTDYLREAVNKGIVFFNISQCPGGRVMHGKYETSKHLEELGIVSGNDITVEAAIVKLMYVLGMNLGPEKSKRLLAKPIKGEMENRK